VKKRMILSLAGCMPLVAAADIMGKNLGFTDASTAVVVVLGAVALVVARRLQKH
jgi:hypothetical protein